MTCTKCERPAQARGLCNTHYSRARRSEALPPGPLPRITHEVILSRISQQSGDGCWLWEHGHSHGGYRQVQGKQAHRVVYELLVGPIAPGMVLDHECHNRDLACVGGDSCAHRRCVRPDHLVQRSRRDNTLASTRSTASIYAAATHCVHGHEFTPENTYRDPSRPRYRQCRECKRRINREIKQRRQAQKASTP